MKRLFIQLITFELASTLGAMLSKMTKDKFSSKSEQNGLAAVLFALKNIKALTVTERGHEMWFSHPLDSNESDKVILIEVDMLDLARVIKLSERLTPRVRQIWQSAESHTFSDQTD